MLTQEKIGLEDLYTDILNKAQRGLRLTVEDLADRTGLSVETIQEVKNGKLDCDVVQKLAFAMNLDAPSLLASAEESWYPETIPAFPGLAMFTTWYGDMTVNAYLLWDPETLEAASFDTGATCQSMLTFLQGQGLQLKKIFITHTHMDHLADLDKLQQLNEGAASYGSAAENPLGLKPLVHGDGFVLGSMRIRVLGTSGHTPGGLSYFVEGLARPVVVVGDALFAGSMGGAPYAYAEALRNNQDRILTLPDNTIICPGHGPLTTVVEEKAHNPFFPDLKRK